MAGVRKVSSRVELINPEKMTTATGCRISVPGRSASNNNGASAKAVTSAVISFVIDAIGSTACTFFSNSTSSRIFLQPVRWSSQL